MKFIMRLGTFALLIFLFTLSTALAAPIKAGPYEATHGDISLFILLNEDGSGFFEGETNNSLEWKQTDSGLVIKIYGEEGSSEFDTYRATVLSSDYFELGGLTYTHEEQVATQANTSPQAEQHLSDLAKLQLLAEQGDEMAQSMMCHMYATGVAPIVDFAQVARFCQKEAEAGEPGAQVIMAMLYEEGSGVPKNVIKAAQLYQKATEQGNAEAQVRLGRMYQFGEGVPKDETRAAQLYRKAIEQGNEAAQELLELLEESNP